ncbi:hypothetical protein SGFS_042980 [Streptomyces graminofaciens]|uniref:Integral membrane protein n=1 Tax=Streptomyces graminofaciens TaxID=68212 RepID=A0ABM7FAH8_9ACTN|nr:hypothetical protein SGFS_042980 [Streptomyces graminofaciens]
MIPLPLDAPPPPPPAPVNLLSRVPLPRVTGRQVRLAVSLLPLLLIAVWAVIDWEVVYGSAVRLASAELSWLLAGAVLAVLCSAATACIRQGTVPERLPPGLLFASQFAAGAAGHVLPANLGAHAVTLRFLQRQGIPLPRATASIALYSLVKPVARTAVIAVFVLALPGTLHLGDLLPDTRTLAVVAAAVALALVAVVVTLTAVRVLRRHCIRLAQTALTDLRLVHRRPSRALALWGGAAALPVLQACVLAAVGASVDLPVSWPLMVFAYLAASTVVGAVPAPGGIGPVDAAVVFTLVAFGAPATLATTTVIGYRLLTVWLPLLPGTLVLSALVRAKAL